MVHTWCILRPKYSCTRMFLSATISGPRNFAMAVFEGLGKAAGGLSNHLQMVDRPDLEHLVLLKDVDAIRDPGLDFRDGFQDVAHAIRIAPHRAIASR